MRANLSTRRFGQGPLKLDEALSIAQQVAKGLEAAHKRGIVHRDIKPENVMVDDAGHVTIMDFGLAQLTDASRLTRTDQTVGTTAYMSPEQTQGSGTDRRTDIWSLGVVLYEMVTGRQPFKGDYDKAVMYSILNEEPEAITALRTGVPMLLEEHVNKCLAKAPAKRYQTAGELLVDLARSAERGDEAPSVVAGVAPRGATRGEVQGLRRLTWALGSLLALAAAALAFVMLGRAPSAGELRVQRFSYDVGPSLQTAVISPDGSRLAYTLGAGGFGLGANSTLFIRSLAEEIAEEVVSSGVTAPPSWSHDGQSLAFGFGGGISKLVLGSSRPVDIAGSGGPMWGSAWSADDRSVFFSAGNPGQVFEVPSDGGEPQLVSGSNPEDRYAGPHIATKADGGKVLFVATWFGAKLVAFDFESQRKVEIGPGSRPFWSPTGHLLYQDAALEGGLWAIPFDLESLQPTGAAVALADQAEQPSVSNDFTLLYLDRAPGWRLLLRDLAGEAIAELGTARYNIYDPVFSPDGCRIVFGADTDNNQDIWTVDVGTGNFDRLTTDAASDRYPVWSTRSDTVVFLSQGHEGQGLYEVSAVGGGSPRLIRLGDLHPDRWDPTGEYLVGHQHYGAGRDIVALRRGEVEGTFETTPVTQTPEIEDFPDPSPDGRYVAYTSFKSGPGEVYVRRFPLGDGRAYKVSLNGGLKPIWRGERIFYTEGDELIAARVRTEPEFEVISRTRLFRHEAFAIPHRPIFDVSPDGKQIVLAEPAEPGRPRAIRVVQNWHKAYLEQTPRP